MNNTSILEGISLTKQFRSPSLTDKGRVVKALDGVDINLLTGETHGIAGESGCGKSTLAKILTGLIAPDSGKILFKSRALTDLSSVEFTQFRRTTQMIFQDPYSSLNPRMRIGDIVSEPLAVAGMSSDMRHAEMLRVLGSVGMSQDIINRFPDEFSGGQRQRIGIARALISSPDILIADEPVSSLDISIQAQIINLLMQLKEDMHLSMLVVSHNLMVLRHICDRITIMYLGIVVESALTSDLFRQCYHPYTEALLASIPNITGEPRNTNPLKDDVPSPLAIPAGCRFHPRCRYAQDICRKDVPPLRQISDNHKCACHFAEHIFLYTTQ